jgi:hypothetical protein
MASPRQFLNVPYLEKDKAKLLGARWDAGQRKWYVPPELDTSTFARWNPQPLEEAPDSGVSHAVGKSKSRVASLDPGLYLLHSTHRCWQCSTDTDVVALVVSGLLNGRKLSRAMVVTDVSRLSSEVEEVLRREMPGYRKDYSKTAGGRYYMNHCGSCDAKLGDFFLHEEVDCAFRASSSRKASRLRLHRVPTLTALQIDGATYGLSNLLYDHARRG